MCACKYKIGSLSDIAGNYETIIAAKDMASGNTAATFKYYYCVSPEKVNLALRSVFIKPGDPLRINNQAEMEVLAKYHDTGEDIRLFNKDIKKVLSQIQFTQDEITKSECKVAFSV